MRWSSSCRWWGLRPVTASSRRRTRRRGSVSFAADEAKNRGRALELRNCRVFEPGRTNVVGTAHLLMQPAPVLVWNGGERKLDDLLPNFNEGGN